MERRLVGMGGSAADAPRGTVCGLTHCVGAGSEHKDVAASKVAGWHRARRRDRERSDVQASQLLSSSDRDSGGPFSAPVESPPGQTPFPAGCPSAPQEAEPAIPLLPLVSLSTATGASKCVLRVIVKLA